jgi:hypothetical protein
MRTYQALIIAGTLVAISATTAIITRYEVTQPFNPVMFTRYDRWTGRVEMCSSLYDNKTYCGSDMLRRAEAAVDMQHVAANKRFLSLGYSQEEIDHWSRDLDRARNMAGNGSSDEAIRRFISACAANDYPCKKL